MRLTDAAPGSEPTITLSVAQDRAEILAAARVIEYATLYLLGEDHVTASDVLLLLRAQADAIERAAEDAWHIARGTGQDREEVDRGS